jgi:hypothetical protein
MLTFGIEIECLPAVRRAAVAEELRNAGLRADVGTYSQRNEPGQWLVKSDGSVGGGVGIDAELVSPVYTLEEMMEALPRVQRALIATRATANHTCGLHVHVGGFESVAIHTIRNVARRIVNLEDSLDMLQPVERRLSNNHFIRSNAAVFGAYGNAAGAKAMWRKIDECASKGDLINLFNPHGERYFKLNLQSLIRHGTIEFRHCAGTVDMAFAAHWVRFINAFVRTAMNQQRLLHKAVTSTETAEERLRHAFRNVPAPTVRALRARVSQMRQA